MGGTLGSAISLAARAHDGQYDRDDIAYIFHPLRVMESVRKAGFTGEYLIAAVLHDTIEDTWVTLSDIHAEFGANLATIVDHLSRREGEVYMDYVARAKLNPVSRIVKTHDVLDNLGRNPKPSEARKYTRAYSMLCDISYET